MNHNELLNGIKSAIYSRNKKSVKEALERLDECLPVEGFLSDEVFAIYLWLLSDSEAAAAYGVEQVFVYLFSNIHKLSAMQIQQIAIVIDRSISLYKNQIFRFSAADFLARSYDSLEAFKLFKKWLKMEERNAKNMAINGLEILILSGRAEKFRFLDEARHSLSIAKQKKQSE